MSKPRKPRKPRDLDCWVKVESWNDHPMVGGPVALVAGMNMCVADLNRLAKWCIAAAEWLEAKR